MVLGRLFNLGQSLFRSRQNLVSAGPKTTPKKGQSRRRNLETLRLRRKTELMRIVV